LSDSLIQDIKTYLTEISEYQTELMASAGFGCIEECGACCKSPQVEATPAEMLPLATELLKDPNWQKTLETLQSAEAPCIFYRPTSPDGEMGRCSVYQMRPSICRLFGASAQKRKDGTLEFSTCVKQKKYFAAAIQNANKNINEKKDVTTMQDFGQKLKMQLLSYPNLAEPLPINQAAAKAMEHLAFYQQYKDEDTKCP